MAGGEPLGTGKVTQVSAAVDSATRGVPVRVRPPDSRRPLRLGETIFGQIVVGVIRTPLPSQLDALVPDGEGFKVFVVDAENIAHDSPLRSARGPIRLPRSRKGSRAASAW